MRTDFPSGYPLVSGFCSPPAPRTLRGDGFDWRERFRDLTMQPGAAHAWATHPCAFGFGVWLDRLGEYLRHKDFDDAGARARFVSKVESLLEEMARRGPGDPVVEAWLRIADEGSASCVDRAALALDDMEIVRQVARAEAGLDPAAQLLALGLAVYRLHEVDAAAQAHVAGLERARAGKGGGVDEVEVRLALRVLLRKPLDLPGAVDSMWYYEGCGVDVATARRVAEQVLCKQAADGGAGFARFLAAWQPWRRHLEADSCVRDRIANVEAGFDRQLSDLLEREDAMRAAERHAAYEALASRRQQALDGVWVDATLGLDAFDACMDAARKGETVPADWFDLLNAQDRSLKIDFREPFPRLYTPYTFDYLFLGAPGWNGFTPGTAGRERQERQERQERRAEPEPNVLMELALHDAAARKRAFQRRCLARNNDTAQILSGSAAGRENRNGKATDIVSCLIDEGLDARALSQAPRD
jgi:hypothetical protein